MQSASRKIVLITLIASSLAASHAGAGKMYQCRNPDGSVEFSNVACSNQDADRDTVMHLRDRQPGERSSSNEMVERANRFAAQREAWAAEERASRQSSAPSSTQLTYKQRRALKKIEKDIPKMDPKLTKAQNEHRMAEWRAKRDLLMLRSGLDPSSIPRRSGDLDTSYDDIDTSSDAMQSRPSQLIDTTTGTVMPRAGGGYIDPRTGTFYHDTGAGVVNTRTGKFTPTH